MNLVKPTKLDDTDWAILDALQEDGRMSVAALARAVNLSPTATTERLNRLRDTGVISAVRAVVDPTVLGFGLTAFIRMRTLSGTRKAFITALTKVPEVLECHHTTGEDCYLIRIVARDMSHLEELTETIASFGETTTSLSYSSPVPLRSLQRGTVTDAH